MWFPFFEAHANMLPLFPSNKEQHGKLTKSGAPPAPRVKKELLSQQSFLRTGNSWRRQVVLFQLNAEVLLFAILSATVNTSTCRKSLTTLVPVTSLAWGSRPPWKPCLMLQQVRCLGGKGAQVPQSALRGIPHYARNYR